MASSINASTTAGVVTTADTSGVLNIQTAGTTAISIDASQAVSFTNSPTVTGGTANGVAYLNGSKVLTTGSALVFDGTNLGIKFTPSAWQANNRAIQVADGYASLSGNSSQGTCDVAYNCYNTTAQAVLGWKYTNSSAAATLYQQLNGAHAWHIAPSGTAGNAITFTQAMTLTAAGRLGIGATSPQATLHVLDDPAGTAGTILLGTSTYYATIATEAAVTGALTYTIASASGGGHTFKRGTTTQFMTDPNGNLLVGTTSTAFSEKFNATQSADQKAGLFFNTNASFTNNVLNLRASRNTTNSSYGFLQCSIDGVADKLYIYDSGNVVNTNNSYGPISDVKLKENIVDATPKLQDLMRVRIVNYNLKAELGYESRKQIGVVAQELEQVFAGLVDERVDRDAEGNDLGTTTKSVKMSVFTPMLIKAIQEQQALITQLQADVAALKGA